MFLDSRIDEWSAKLQEGIHRFIDQIASQYSDFIENHSTIIVIGDNWFYIARYLIGDLDSEKLTRRASIEKIKPVTTRVYLPLNKIVSDYKEELGFKESSGNIVCLIPIGQDRQKEVLELLELESPEQNWYAVKINDKDVRVMNLVLTSLSSHLGKEESANLQNYTH